MSKDVKVASGSGAEKPESPGWNEDLCGENGQYVRRGSAKTGGLEPSEDRPMLHGRPILH